jgi:hypothetical protein
MRNFRTIVMASLLAALLVACAKPLPADRSGYAGEWKGGPVSLLITEDGRVKYARKEGGMSKSLEAPIKEFKGDNFVVGVGFMSTEFVVTAPPHEDGNEWKMTVDGIELTRTSPDTTQGEAPGSTST